MLTLLRNRSTDLPPSRVEDSAPRTGRQGSPTVATDQFMAGLAVIICGLAHDGPASATEGYYTAQGNRFWRTLHEIGLTPRQLAPAEGHTLSTFGIGLTGLVLPKVGTGDAGRALRAESMRLHSKVVQWRPRYLCFNGKRAAREFFQRTRVDYGIQDEVIGRTLLFVAPSTSAMALTSWDPGAWHELAERVRTMTAPTTVRRTSTVTRLSRVRVARG